MIYILSWDVRDLHVLYVFEKPVNGTVDSLAGSANEGYETLVAIRQKNSSVP